MGHHLVAGCEFPWLPSGASFADASFPWIQGTPTEYVGSPDPVVALKRYEAGMTGGFNS